MKSNTYGLGRRALGIAVRAAVALCWSWNSTPVGLRPARRFGDVRVKVLTVQLFAI